MADQQTDTTDGFLADALGILQANIDPDTAQKALKDAYTNSDWDDKERAANIYSEFSQKLRYAYQQDSNAGITPEHAASTAPIPLPEDTSNTDLVNDWEQKNLDVLNKTTDADWLSIKTPLQKGISDYAQELRRKDRGTTDGSLLSNARSATAEMISGGLHTPLSLVGLNDLNKYIESYTDPQYEGSLSSGLLRNLGFVGTAAATGGIGSAVGGAAIGVGAELGYLGTTAVNSALDVRQQSLEATGDQARANKAALIEGAAQSPYLLLPFLGPLSRFLGKTVGTEAAATLKSFVENPAGREAISIEGKEITLDQAKGIISKVKPEPDFIGKVARSGIQLEAMNAASGAISQEARNYGTNDYRRSLMEGAMDQIGVGALLGLTLEGTHYAATKLDNKRVIPESLIPPLRKDVNKAPVQYEKSEAYDAFSSILDKNSELNDEEYTAPELPNDTPEDRRAEAKVVFQTDKGEEHFGDIPTQTYTFNPESNSYTRAFDKTFAVDPEVASNLEKLDDAATPDEKIPRIITDGQKLIVESPFVNEKGEITSDLQPGTKVVIDTKPLEEGASVIRVNKPKNTNGFTDESAVDFGGTVTKIVKNEAIEPPREPEHKSLSAAAEPTTESGLGRNIRERPIYDQSIKEVLGTSEESFLKYFPKSAELSSDTADQFIAKHGPIESYNYVISIEHPQRADIFVAAKLAKGLNRTIKDAKAVGDIELQSRLVPLAEKLLRKYSEVGTSTGQISEAYKQFYNENSDFRFSKLSADAIDQIYQQEAGKLGIPKEDLYKADERLKQIDSTIESVNQEAKGAAEAEAQTHEETLKEHKSLIDAIKNNAEEKLKNEKDKHERAISQEENAIKTAEADFAQKQKDYAAKEQKAKELEQKGISEGPTVREDRIKRTEELVGKETNPIRKQAISEELEKFKQSPLHPEEGLSADEKKELNKLRKELQNKPELSPKLEAKKERLVKIKDQKESLTIDDFLKDSDKKKIDILQKRAEEAQKKKEAAINNKKLTPEQEKRIKELTKKKETIQKVKNKVEEKTQTARDKIDEIKERVQTILNEAEKTPARSIRDKLYVEAAKLEETLSPSKGNQQSFLTSFLIHNALSSIKTPEKVFGFQSPLLFSEAFAKSLGTLAHGYGITPGILYLKSGVDSIFSLTHGISKSAAAFRAGLTGEAPYTKFNESFTEPPTENSDYYKERAKRQPLNFFSDNPVVTKAFDKISSIPIVGKGITAVSKGTQFMVNLLSAVHAGGYTTQKEAQLAFETYIREREDIKALRKYVSDPQSSTITLGQKTYTLEDAQGKVAEANISGDKAVALATTRNIMKESSESYQAARTQAEESLQNLERAGVAIENTLPEKLLKKLKLDPREAYLQQLTYEILDSKKPDVAVEAAHLYAQHLNLLGEPIGYYKRINNAVDDLTVNQEGDIFAKWKGQQYRVPVLKYISIFKRAALNITSLLNDWTGLQPALRYFNDPELVPYHLKVQEAQKFLDTVKNGEFPSQTDIDSAQKQLDKANGDYAKIADTLRTKKYDYAGKTLGTVLGLTAGGTLISMLCGSDPHKEQLIDIYGSGPNDYSRRQQLKVEGRYMSLKVGDTYLPISHNPLGGLLTMLAQIRDKQRYDKGFDDVAMNLLTQIMGGAAVTALSDLGIVKNLTDTVDAITRFAKGESSGISAIENSLGYTAANTSKLFVPGSSFLGDIARITDNPIQTYNSFLAKILSGIPIAQSLAGEPALNRFGEPIHNSNPLSNWGQIFSPLAIFGETDPNWNWLSSNGYTLPAPLTTVSITNNAHLKETREERLGRTIAGKLTSEEQTKVIQNSGPQIKAIVENYRQRYGNSAWDPKVQDRLKKEVQAVDKRARDRLIREEY